MSDLTTKTRHPLRLLHLITPSRISGAERVSVDLCQGLRDHGHTMVLGTKIGSPFVPFARSHGLECLELNIRGKGNLAAPLAVGRVVRERRVDLIDTHLSTASLWGGIVGRALHVPVVSHVQALNTKTCYVLADEIICCANAVKEHLCRQGMRSEKIHVIFNSIDLERFTRRQSSRTAKRDLGFDENAFLVGVAAHLSEKKGHAYLLRAVGKLKDRFPSLQLVLCGDGPEREALEHLAQSLGIGSRVRLAGFITDMVPYLHAMDALCLPSLSKEGLPTTLIEAGAMALPTIATDIGGAAEIIEPGVTGFIVPPADSEALAEALARLLSDPAECARMGRAAEARMHQTFSLANTVRNVEAVYFDLLRRKGRL